VVFTSVSDPVGSGFVETFPKPGGNATGFVNFEPTMVGKWMQILKEVAPSVTHFTLLFNPNTMPAEYFLRSVGEAAQSLSLTSRSASVVDVAAIESEITNTAREPGAGLIVLPNTFTFAYRDQITKLASRLNLPAVYPFREFADAGGLIAYGTDQYDLQRRAASYVDRILKGDTPADLPVQAPTKFELVINLKTAKALGLTVPQTLLVRADEV